MKEREQELIKRYNELNEEMVGQRLKRCKMVLENQRDFITNDKIWMIGFAFFACIVGIILI